MSIHSGSSALHPPAGAHRIFVTTTCRFGMPRSWHYWSTTAIGSRTGHIEGRRPLTAQLDGNG